MIKLNTFYINIWLTAINIGVFVWCQFLSSLLAAEIVIPRSGTTSDDTIDIMTSVVMKGYRPFEYWTHLVVIKDWTP